MSKSTKLVNSKPSAPKSIRLYLIILILVVAGIMAWLLTGNYSAQSVNTAWATSFFSALNSYKASNSLSPLSSCSSLNVSAQRRFITTSQNYQISHYNFTQDIDKFLFDQNITNYSLTWAEDIFSTGYKTPSDFFSYVIKNASAYYPYLINTTARYYGYYIGTANAYLTNVGCEAPPAPPGANFASYYDSYGCNSSIETASWFVVELSNKCPILQNPPANFTEFKDNFNSAPRVNIYVTAQNGTELSSTVGCATTLIERIVDTKQTHRSPSTISFYVMNSTSCVYSSNSLSGTIKNYTYASTEHCLNFSKGVQSIFLNYSQLNTTAVKPNSLYISGSAALFNNCGIATQLS